MQVPIQIDFQNMDRSDAVEAKVRDRAEKLERFFPRIVGCRVTVVAPHRHHRHGGLYEVHIDVDVPGKHILVNHVGPKNHAHEDVYVAVRDAFDAARRRLEDHARKVRGKVKRHAERPAPGESENITQPVD